MFLAGWSLLKQFNVKRYSLDSDKASFLWYRISTVENKKDQLTIASITELQDNCSTNRSSFSIIIGAVADYSLDCYFVRRYADQRHLNEFKPLRVSRFISYRDINECVNSPDNNNQVI